MEISNASTRILAKVLSQQKYLIIYNTITWKTLLSCNILKCIYFAFDSPALYRYTQASSMHCMQIIPLWSWERERQVGEKVTLDGLQRSKIPNNCTFCLSCVLSSAGTRFPFRSARNVMRLPGPNSGSFNTSPSEDITAHIAPCVCSVIYCCSFPNHIPSLPACFGQLETSFIHKDKYVVSGCFQAPWPSKINTEIACITTRTWVCANMGVCNILRKVDGWWIS